MSLNFVVYDGSCGGKVFATFHEAKGYANYLWSTTGFILSVERTRRQPTHKFLGVEKYG